MERAKFYPRFASPQVWINNSAPDPRNMFVLKRIASRSQGMFCLRQRPKPSITFRCLQSDSAPDLYKNVNYEDIAKGDETTVKKLKMIMLELEVQREGSGQVPSSMTDDRWKELLACSSYSQRSKQLRFWWLNEQKRASDKRKKELKRLEKPPKIEEETDHIKYGLSGSNLFLRVYDTTIDRFLNSRLIQAMMFGQNVVMDCSYDQYMTPKEASNCAKQLVFCFSENRSHSTPFNLNFCNVNFDGTVMRKVKKLMPNIDDEAFPANVTSASYLDVFPKDRLVYLTPHCREELLTYNHDDVYIIGAMVDKVNNEPLSLGKAKAEGLRMAKLPLDRFLDWGLGSKSLTLNQVVKILLDMQISQDWDKALSHVPTRKIKSEEEIKAQKRFSNPKTRRSRLIKDVLFDWKKN